MSPSSTSSSELSGRPGADGRVWSEGPAAAGRLARGSALLCVAIFLVATAGFGAWDAWRPVPGPRLKGAERARLAQERRRADWKDGTLTALWTKDADERSNLRHHTLPTYAALLLRGLRETGGRVVVGEQGWLYLPNRITTRSRWSDERIGRFGASLFRVLERGLARRGSRLVVYVIPRKAVVAAEHLPRDYDPRPGVERSFVAELARARVEAVDLAQAFAPFGDEVWYREDTHWSPLGQWLAAQAVCRAAGILAPEEDRRGTIDLETRKRARQYLLGTAGVSMERPWIRRLFPADVVQKLAPVARPTRSAQLPDAPVVGVVGTSFTEGESFLGDVRLLSSRPVDPGGRLGFGWASNLDRYLAAREGGLPPLLLFEFAVYPLLQFLDSQGTVVPAELERMLVELNSVGPHATLVGGGDIERFGLVERRVRGSSVRSLARDLVVTSGDGVLGLRFRLRGAGRKARLQLRVGDVRQELEWRAGDRELVLPWLASEGGGPPARVQVEGAARLELDLVTAFDLGAQQRALLGPSTSAGPWTEVLGRFEPPLDPRSDQALLARMAAPEQTRGHLELELLLEDGTRRPLLPRTVIRSDGFALLALPGDLSSPVRSVRARTRGQGLAVGELGALPSRE